VEFSRSFDISPDGEEVVYTHRPEDPDRKGHVLKIIPARGGHARTVGTYPGSRPIWADDGFIYLLSGDLASAPEAGYDRGYSIRRVPAAGGEAEILSNWPGAWSVDLSRDARTFLYRVPPRSEASGYEVASVHGQRLARFTLPDNMAIEACFTRDALECLAVTTDGAAPLKVIPINGGPTRQLTESHANTWPLGWTPDGREVVFSWELDGTGVIMSTPATGRVMEELHRTDAEEWVYGPLVMDGRYVLYGVEDGPDGAVVLTILDIQTGSEREITRTPWVDYTFYNTSRADGHFLYAERNGGRFEFRAVGPEGDPMLLRAFPDSAFPPIIGFHGDRIAYWTRVNDGSTLYLAQAGEDEALTVLHFPGRVGQRTLNPPTWSPDGRYLVTGYQNSETRSEDALVVEIDESGEAVGNPWLVEGLPTEWSRIRWMPDSEGFLVVDGSNVWLASIHGDVPPVNLTQEEVGSIWFYQLSPDGRHIAVSPGVRMGGSLWRVDLEEVLAGYKR
jgi:Tol biopolymer transport system component